MPAVATCFSSIASVIYRASAHHVRNGQPHFGACRRKQLALPADLQTTHGLVLLLSAGKLTQKRVLLLPPHANCMPVANPTGLCRAL